MKPDQLPIDDADAAAMAILSNGGIYLSLIFVCYGLYSHLVRKQRVPFAADDAITWSSIFWPFTVLKAIGAMIAIWVVWCLPEKHDD